MSPKRVERGFTLLEVLIASGLGLLVLAMLHTCLVPALRAAPRVADRVEMQQQAQLVFHTLQSDLQRSVATGISASTGSGGSPARLGIVGIQGLVPSQRVKLYDTKMAVYSWEGAGQPIIRRTWTSPGPPTLSHGLDGRLPAAFTGSDLALVASADALPRRVLASGVKMFSVAATASLMQVAIQLERASGETFELSTSMTLRNRP